MTMPTNSRKSQQPTAHPGILRWPLNVIVLAVIGLPSFIGYPLGLWTAEVVNGVPWSWVVYWVLVLAVARGLLGARMFANIAAMGALIALPVVFAGGSISWLAIVLGWSRETFDSAGSHYVRLCLTMLTVVPLALALVALVPLGQLEQRLLFKPQGVSSRQKKILMVLRVFNHIAFTVLPGTLEILREERQEYKGPVDSRAKGAFYLAAILRLRQGLAGLVNLAVGTICAALQYIPLWAYEIGQLPETVPENEDDPISF
jgi:hypothetical protein